MPAHKWQYFMHVTRSPQTLLSILESGFIKGFNNCIWNYEPLCKKGVYCHYIFDGLPKKLKRWNYNNNRFILVLRPEVAKDLEMYVCNSVEYGYCVEDKDSRITHTKGRLKRMPSFQKTRKHILRRIEESTKKTAEHSYILNHEVLFPEDVPIKYVAAILVPKQRGVKVEGKKQRMADYQQEMLEKYAANHGLNMKIIQYAKTDTDFHKYFEQI